jgi:hypothetical protein
MPNEVCPGTLQAENTLAAVFTHPWDQGQLFADTAADLLEGLGVLELNLVGLETLIGKMVQVLALSPHERTDF